MLILHAATAPVVDVQGLLQGLESTRFERSESSFKMEIRLIVFAVLISQLVAPVGAFGTPARLPGPRAAWSIPSCNGKYKGGLKPSPEELADILKKNEEETKTLGRWWWLDNPSRTNLCEADLGGANLIGAHLSGVDLSRANLSGAQLGLAKLNGAGLQFAHVEGAVFDVWPDSLPDPISLSFAEGLESLKFSESPM